jgi:serine/threonine-protein kinase
VKLLDFGIVKLVGDAAAELGGDKLTNTGVAFGTPGYMSPEQALGRPVDGRADLYTLGVIVFEMLVGRPVFVDRDAVALLRKHCAVAPETLAAATGGAPFATPAMEALVAGALAKQPEQRWQSAEQMIAVLDDAFGSIDHLPGEDERR